MNDTHPETDLMRQTVQSGFTGKVPDHLSNLYTRATTNLTRAKKERVADLLIHFQGTLSRDEWDLGLTNLTKHAIPTGDSAPIRQPPRRIPLPHAEAEKQAIED